VARPALFQPRAARGDAGRVLIDDTTVYLFSVADTYGAQVGQPWPVHDFLFEKIFPREAQVITIAELPALLSAG
jgi:hypothetical protein